MSAFLFESPLALGVAGAAMTLAAAVTWIKGGFPAALYASLALLILTIALILMNLSVKTDREQVESLMHDVAAAVQRNDLPGVLKHIHPSATEGLRRAKTEFPNYKFTEARITGIKSIEVNEETTPPSAVAEFNVAVSITAHGNSANGIRRFVRCYFFREGDQWLVSDYQHFDIADSFKRQP